MYDISQFRSSGRHFVKGSSIKQRGDSGPLFRIAKWRVRKYILRRLARGRVWHGVPVYVTVISENTERRKG
jgi:hypothetical protein